MVLRTGSRTSKELSPNASVRGMASSWQRRASVSRRTRLDFAFQSLRSLFSFDMMGKIVWKTYWGLTNIILRVSNGTEAGKANAVLVNSHLDR